MKKTFKLNKRIVAFALVFCILISALSVIGVSATCADNSDHTTDLVSCTPVDDVQHVFKYWCEDCQKNYEYYEDHTYDDSVCSVCSYFCSTYVDIKYRLILNYDGVIKRLSDFGYNVREYVGVIPSDYSYLQKRAEEIKAYKADYIRKWRANKLNTS